MLIGQQKRNFQPHGEVKASRNVPLLGLWVPGGGDATGRFGLPVPGAGAGIGIRVGAVGRTFSNTSFSSNASFALLPNSSLLPTNTCTIIVIGREVALGNAGIGVDSAALGDRCGISLTNASSFVDWDFGGADVGITRLRSGAIANLNDLDVWACTTGPRGMEIWRNGRLIASNAANPTRSATTSAWGIGLNGSAWASNSREPFRYGLVALSASQLAAGLLSKLTSPAAAYGELFAPLPRRIWAPSGSSAPVSALAATGATATFSATASGGTLAALAATGSTGVFSGAANSVSSGSLAATGSTGAFSAAANSTTSVVLAATGESGGLVGSAFSAAVVAAAVAGVTGAFAGSAGAGTSAVLSAAGASGAFVGAANSTTTAVLSVAGSSGAFSGAAGAGVVSALSAAGSSGAFSGAAFVSATVALAAVGGAGAFSGVASSGSISAAVEIVRLASLITTTVLADSGICKSLPMSSHISRRIDLISAIDLVST